MRIAPCSDFNSSLFFGARRSRSEAASPYAAEPRATCLP